MKNTYMVIAKTFKKLASWVNWTFNTLKYKIVFIFVNQEKNLLKKMKAYRFAIHKTNVSFCFLWKVKYFRRKCNILQMRKKDFKNF